MIQVLDSVDSCNIFWVQVAGEINDRFSCVSITEKVRRDSWPCKGVDGDSKVDNTSSLLLMQGKVNCDEVICIINY